MKAVDGAARNLRRPHARVDTGGAMIERAPNDPAWYKGGLGTTT